MTLCSAFKATAAATTIVLASSAATAQSGQGCGDFIDFEGESGYVSSATSLFGHVVSIMGDGTTSNDPANAAIIFDSSNPTGGDFDLGTPNELCNPPGPGVGVAGQPGMPNENCNPLGNLLILQENLNDPMPDDDSLGGTLYIDFGDDYPVLVHGVTIIDTDRAGGTITFMNDGNPVGSEHEIPEAGDNGVINIAIVDVPVTKMIVTFLGSGGVDNIVFSEDCNENGVPDCDDPDDDGDGIPNDCAVECLLVVGSEPGITAFTAINHTFWPQVDQVLEYYPVTMADIPEFVLPAPSVANPMAGYTLVNDYENPFTVQTFTVQVLMWNPVDFPQMPEQYTSGLQAHVMPNGRVLTRPYGDAINMGITAETFVNEQRQLAIRFPFTIDW